MGTDMIKGVFLTTLQQAAVIKLREFTEFKSAYSLQMGRNTLDALVRKGIADQKVGEGAMFCPRTAISYKIKEEYR